MKNIKYLLLLLLISSTLNIYPQDPEWIVYNTSNSLIADNCLASVEIDERGTKWIGNTD